MVSAKSRKHWWQKSKTKMVDAKPSWYKLNCPYCHINFHIDSKWPSQMQHEECWEQEDETFWGQLDFYGLKVFEVFCPSCGQILRFDLNETPIGNLKWKKIVKHQ